MSERKNALERQAARQERIVKSSAHEVAVANAMAPDPREWEYTGECFDAGKASTAKCACGTAIRYCFIVRRERDRKTLNIGSVCIDHTVPYLIANGAQGLADRLKAAVLEHKRLLEEQKRREAEARASDHCEAIRAYYDELNAWRKALKEATVGNTPDFVYAAFPRLKPSSTPPRTASAWAQRAARFYGKLVAFHLELHDRRGLTDLPASTPRWRYPVPKPPVPPEPVLAKVARDLAQRLSRAEKDAKRCRDQVERTRGQAPTKAVFRGNEVVIDHHKNALDRLAQAENALSHVKRLKNRALPETPQAA